jgi:hypothetical protein
MSDSEVLEAIGPHVHDGKLKCKDALEVAARLQVKPIVIGRVCNQQDIRIINCQLGCFGAVSKRQDK